MSIDNSAPQSLTFRVDEAPAGSAVAVGSVLSLRQVAQLLECNAADLAARSALAARVFGAGFTLSVRRA